MDQRQPPPHPFSRNPAPTYTRPPFPPSSNQAPYPPSSHPSGTAPSYIEHQRRPSDPPPYYNAQRGYGQDGPPLAGPGHSRHQSASSIGHGTPVSRGMPPPSSPQQGQQHPNYNPSQRAPPVSVGPLATFTSNRELPALPSGQGQRGGMSIMDMLGGPPASREQAQQYGSPIAASNPPNLMFGPAHASPRIQSTGPDYAPFRRPQTPENQRAFGPRDHRANSAGSPPHNHYGTPEARQVGQFYRGPATDDRRELSRVPNPNAIPPRPNSQPNSFNPSPHRALDSRPPPNEFGRRVDNLGRPQETGRTEQTYQRPAFDERQDPRYGYTDRERLDRDREAAVQREIQRERDHREQREQRERAEQERQQVYALQLAQRNALAYTRANEREPTWLRPGYGESHPPAYEQNPERPLQEQIPNGFEYPSTSAPPYPSHPAEPRNDPRFVPISQPPPHNSLPAAPYDISLYERQQRAIQAQQQQSQSQQSTYEPPRQNSQYANQESPVRRLEESHPMQQSRSFLGIQEINRKGRISPLPQAVQGAQGQMSGPVGEASIKNEFNRMFSGIGSGVGSAMGVSSPTAAGPQNMTFSSAGQFRRDDAESLQNSPVEIGGHKISRTTSRGGRRRKLKEEDSKGDDEGSTGRRTPSGRGKRVKNHHHHHHHHHHHRIDTQEPPTLSPNLTPFKNVQGPPIPSPPGPEKEVSNLHHHHVPVSGRQHHHHHKVQINPQIPLPSLTIHSNEVLDEVRKRKRRHIGHGYYESVLKPASNSSRNGPRKGTQGFSSTPKPLPRFEESQVNCIYTVKVSRAHLTHSSLQEITSRKALWGTDIYTDDSDVIAACIHQGWFRGAWDETVDIALLGLELQPKRALKDDNSTSKDQALNRPPPHGPEDIPQGHDIHVDVVVLPTLEEYSSTVRFGIRSREFGIKREGYQSHHDGMSFMIDKVAFVSGVDGEVGRGGLSRRKLITQKLQENESSDEEYWGSSMSRNKSQFQESFVRGRPGPFKGIGTKSWWKEPTKPDLGKGKEKEEVIEAPPQPPPVPRTPIPDIPQRYYAPLDPPIPSPISIVDPQTDIERVTELMIENANTATMEMEIDTDTDEPISTGSPLYGRARQVEALMPGLQNQESEREREVLSVLAGIGGNIELQPKTIIEGADGLRLGEVTQSGSILDTEAESSAMIS